MMVVSRYYLKSIIGMTVLTTVILFTVVMSIFVVDLLLDIAADQMPLSLIIKCFIAYAPELMLKVLPLSFALGIVLAMDQLNRQGERLALLSLGVTRFRQWGWCALWASTGAVICLGISLYGPFWVESASKYLNGFQLQSMLGRLEPYALKPIPGPQAALMTLMKPSRPGQLNDVWVIMPSLDRPTKIWQARHVTLAEHSKALTWHFKQGQLIQAPYQLKPSAILKFNDLTEVMPLKRHMRLKTIQPLEISTWKALGFSSEYARTLRQLWHQRIMPCMMLMILSLLSLVTLPLSIRQQRWFQYLPLACCVGLYQMGSVFNQWLFEHHLILDGLGLWPIHALMGMLLLCLSVRWCCNTQ